jgi:hypothetical protein
VEGDFEDLRFSGLSVEFELDPVELEGCIGWIWEGIRGIEFLLAKGGFRACCDCEKKEKIFWDIWERENTN